MEGLLENIGIFAIFFLILFIFKKISEYYCFKHSIYYEDDKVYKAAKEFASEASLEDVKNILADCIDFDEEDVEEILSQESSYRKDKDGGYITFLKCVNNILGKKVYSW
ncbi:MAG: hypothetical protein WC677_03985 [Clostridia bacterium]|jgi:hypothetical protein